MIWIDYHQGTHGSFLGYVTNVWIAKTPPVPGHDIFSQETGAAHRFHKNHEYNVHTKITPAHLAWPELAAQVRNQEPIVRLSVSPIDRQLLYIPIVNMWYRAGDLGFQQRFDTMYQEREHDRQRIRPFFEHAIKEMLTIQPFDDFQHNPSADFDFRSFFDWGDFCRALRSMANFLGMSFQPTPDLYELWYRFVQINQGWQSYNRCEQVLEHVFAGSELEFELDIFEEAWLNINLRDMFGSIPERLQQADYPRNTAELRRICYNV